MILTVVIMDVLTTMDLINIMSIKTLMISINILMMVSRAKEIISL
jgi:hypothetical protein